MNIISDQEPRGGYEACQSMLKEGYVLGAPALRHDDFYRSLRKQDMQRVIFFATDDTGRLCGWIRAMHYVQKPNTRIHTLCIRRNTPDGVSVAKKLVVAVETTARSLAREAQNAATREKIIFPRMKGVIPELGFCLRTLGFIPGGLWRGQPAFIKHLT